MRQQGMSMDEVVNKLQEAAQQLPRQERHHLGDLVMEWEEKYGTDPRSSLPPTPVPQPVQSTIAPVKKLEPPIRRLHTGRLPAQQPTAFGTRFLDPSKVPELNREPVSPPISCPHCGIPNSASSVSCQACGQVLRVRPAPPTRRLDKTNSSHSNPLVDYFGPKSTLLIAIRGVKGILEAFPRSKMMIGRGFSPVQGQPFLDLSTFDGEALGVSRYHLEIRFLNNTLVITDLDSDNGTYVNGSRLYPYEIRVLHNGDELCLGKLTMKVSFKPAT